MKTIYDKLKPELKKSLQESARKYNTAKRLKYVLMSKVIWQDLTVSELSDVITYTNLSSYKLSSYDFMYGDTIINNK
jgi:SUMO ligase MMS21 Smc5/6 complex component